MKTIFSTRALVPALTTLVLGASLSFSATAQTAADYSVATFFKRAEFQSMSLSPDGKRLAALTPFKGRANLVVIDLDKRTRNIVTSFSESDVGRFNWLTNERLSLSVADVQEASGRFNYKGSYAINADGSDLRDLTTFDKKIMNVSFLGVVPDSDSDVIASMNLRTRDGSDVYQVNTKTSRYKLLTFENPGRVEGWVLDRNLVPRFAYRTDKKEMNSLWYRDSADAKWEKLREWRTDDETMDPISFDYDNNTVYMSSNIGRDKAAIYKWDSKTRKLGELVFEHPMIDVQGGLIFDRVKKKLVGLTYDADKPVTIWYDEEYKKIQMSVDKQFPKHENRLLPARDNPTKVLIFSHSDVDPGRYFLLDWEKKSMEALPEQRPWLKPELMAERRYVKYTARDGLEISAWVTLPKGKDPKNLPLIINIHGGPQVRAYGWVNWGRWPEAQFLASRGYVVLEPEPRHSTGFGQKHYKSGFRQWGLTMQDDITDGALHLVKTGMVDKNRMCLHGGSYGGYAALQGLVKEPDLFKCGNSFVAVTDLGLFQTISYSDIAQGSDYFEEGAFIWRVGDNKQTPELFQQNSPARHANKIKAKVLLTMGASDLRVPLKHGDTMRDAMLKAGVSHEYVVYKNEGHGYNKDENVIDFYTRSEKFFADSLQPK